MTKKDEWSELIVRLVVLKSDLMKAGMYKTAHEIEKAVKVSGFELADQIMAEAIT